MNTDFKRILIVDDSEIEREVLKSILCDEFDVMEADNGYNALEVILEERERLDAILLDISMPVLDGFSVLALMRENEITDIPVFLITAEATKENVQKALKFNIQEFIRKPFDREEVLRRLKAKLGIVADMELSEEDIQETRKFINDAKEVYKKYLANFNKDTGHYLRMTALMKILLSKYAANNGGIERAQVDIISEAAFFCDIGFMMLPNTFRGVTRDDMDNEAYQSHTFIGRDIVELNRSKPCAFFTQVCADMCMHHHERYDGGGFPDRIYGNNNSVYTQMCRLVDEFDRLYFKYREHNEMQFDFVISELAQDKGAVSPEVFQLLTASKFNIVMYYNAKV